MISRPIFFIGAPRSGTTILFEAFAMLSSLGWLSNYSEMWPAWPSANILCPLLDNRLIRLRGNKKQYGRVVLGNRYLPQPVEAYNFWDRYTERDFSGSFLLGETASPDEATRVIRQIEHVLRYQRKKRFATKLTGPARIGYLSSIFNDAIFVNVVRDGRAVVHSLLNVKFWREKGGGEGPFWQGGLNEADIKCWIDSHKDPAILCALQWNKILELTQTESLKLEHDQFITVKYEDYIANPSDMLSSICRATGVAPPSNTLGQSGFTSPLTNQNTKYIDDMPNNTINRITEIMRPMLTANGYLTY